MKIRFRRHLLGVAVTIGVGAALFAAAAGAAPPTAPLQLTPVGRLPFPERGYVIDLPAGAAISKNSVQVQENAIGIGEFDIEALSASGVSYGTVLAIDASDSMAGKPEAGAIAAANTFAQRQAANQEIGVVAFNGSVNVIHQPTIDAGQLHQALSRAPSLGYGTRLFDAVQRSIQVLGTNKISAGSVVILSDGADLGSQSTLAKVVAAARARHVRVFTVGLRSGAFDGETLRALAAQTGGSYGEASSPGELASIYSQLSSKLSREYLLTYRSLAAPGATVDVSVSLAGVGRTTTRYVAPTPSELPPFHRPFVRRFVLSGWSLALLAIVIAALIALAVRLLLDAARSRVVERIRAFSGDEDDAAVETPGWRKTDDWRRRATRARASGSSAARGWLGRLDEQVDIGRVKASPTMIVAATAVGTVVAMVILASISPYFIVLGLGVPLIARSWVRWKVRKVRFAFAEQLPPNLQVLASGLRAGFTLLGAMVAMAEHANEPSRSEFERALTDERLGVPLEEAIRRVAARMASRDLEQVALLSELLRTTGGNAAEVLDVIVLTVRERQDIRRLVRTLTAQGRMGRWILTGLPIATGLAFWAIQPKIVGGMWQTGSGQVLLVVAAAMVATGSYVIQRIIEIEV